MCSIFPGSWVNPGHDTWDKKNAPERPPGHQPNGLFLTNRVPVVGCPGVHAQMGLEELPIHWGHVNMGCTWTRLRSGVSW